MFPLASKIFPPNAEALRSGLEESLLRFVRPTGPTVMVEERNYPELEAIRISLDGASAGQRPARIAMPVGAVEPALWIADFSISGQPILIQGAEVNFSCSAHQARLDQGQDADGKILLLLQKAKEGRVEIALALADLEALVLAGVKTEATRQGVTVDSVRIELRARSERALDVVVQVRAKKLFLTAALRISGSVAIDQQLQAKLSGLACDGDGTLATLACGAIAPHLQRFNGREFSLMALPLGEIKLRDVRISTGRKIRLTAEFGGVA
jgi:hypothetical protein